MYEVISYSLYGTNERYTIGAIKNALLAQEFFPNAQVWFYVGQSVPLPIKQTLELMMNVRVKEVDEPEDNFARLWRYYAFSDEKASLVLCRDVDARLGQRESVAHAHFKKSLFDAHILKDHPTGHNYLISAGMFSAYTKNLRDMKELIAHYRKTARDYYMTDQDFLASIIYPRIKDKVLVHDDYYNTQVEGKSERRNFPTERISTFNHIGAALNADDTFAFIDDANKHRAETGSTYYETGQ